MPLHTKTKRSWWPMEAEKMRITETYESLESRTRNGIHFQDFSTRGWVKNKKGNYCLTIDNNHPKSYIYINSDGSTYRRANGCAVHVAPDRRVSYEISSEILAKHGGYLMRGKGRKSAYYVFEDGFAVKAVSTAIEVEIDDLKIARIRSVENAGESKLHFQADKKGNYHGTNSVVLDAISLRDQTSRVAASVRRPTLDVCVTVSLWPTANEFMNMESLTAVADDLNIGVAKRK